MLPRTILSRNTVHIPEMKWSQGTGLMPLLPLPAEEKGNTQVTCEFAAEFVQARLPRVFKTEPHLPPLQPMTGPGEQTISYLIPHRIAFLFPCTKHKLGKLQPTMLAHSCMSCRIDFKH